MPYRKYYQANKEAYLEYNRRYQEEYYKKHPETRYAKYAKWNREYGKKHARSAETLARQKVRKAVAAGTLIKGTCIVTGCARPTEGHHPDYSKPLDVMWLCRPHHAELHIRLREGRKTNE